MIEMVTLAEERLKRGRKTVFKAAALPKAIAPLAEVAPILRGACARRPRIEGACQRLVLEFRGGDAVLNYVDGKELARYAQAGVVTPDHTIRTKNWPLIVPAPEAGKLDDFKSAAQRAAEEFIADYKAYFERNVARLGQSKDHARPAAAGHPGAGARPVRARPQQG